MTYSTERTDDVALDDLECEKFVAALLKELNPLAYYYPKLFVKDPKVP